MGRLHLLGLDAGSHCIGPLVSPCFPGPAGHRQALSVRPCAPTLGAKCPPARIGQSCRTAAPQWAGSLLIVGSNPDSARLWRRPCGVASRSRTDGKIHRSHFIVFNGFSCGQLSKLIKPLGDLAYNLHLRCHSRPSRCCRPRNQGSKGPGQRSGLALLGFGNDTM
jgi:hypothetical protein